MSPHRPMKSPPGESQPGEYDNPQVVRDEKKKDKVCTCTYIQGELKMLWAVL